MPKTCTQKQEQISEVGNKLLNHLASKNFFYPTENKKEHFPPLRYDNQSIISKNKDLKTGANEERRVLIAIGIAGLGTKNIISLSHWHIAELAHYLCPLINKN